MCTTWGLGGGRERGFWQVKIVPYMFTLRNRFHNNGKKFDLSHFMTIKSKKNGHLGGCTPLSS